MRGTVAEFMITAPKTLPADTTIRRVQAAFDDDHVHLILLVRNDILHGTLLRADLPADPDPAAPALPPARLTGRTTVPDEPALAARERLIGSGQRRLAVVDGGNRLLGLLCLKRTGTGFCSDRNVAARAAERQ